MKLDIKKNDIELLYDKGRFDKIMEIARTCGNYDEKLMTEFIINNNKRELVDYLLTLIYKINRLEELKEFMPYKAKKGLFDKKQTKEYKEIWSGKITEKSFSEILRLFNDGVSGDNLVGIYRTSSYVPDNILEDGLLCDRFPLSVHYDIEEMVEFDYMLKELVELPKDEKVGVFLFKIPNEGIERKVPIYYRFNGKIYLNPEFVVCYIPVDPDTRRILCPVLKYNYKRIPSSIYENDGESVKKVVIKSL